jgi:hypothetical protein
MAFPVPHSSLMATDLVHNPVPCPVSPHDPFMPATHVVEAVFVNDEDIDRHLWLVCATPSCQDDARLHVESFDPDSYELRPATVGELELVSGMDVTGQLTAGAA